MSDIWNEMSKVQVAYVSMDGVTAEQVESNKCDALCRFQEIRCHILFDVKMDFMWKARFVAGGPMTEAPSSVTYSSMVSYNSVKIVFLVAALNDLDVMACGISNAYLIASCKEKIWFVAGPECGPNA